MGNYQDLIVWQKGMDLCEAIYQVTADLPQSELYGLTSQLRRAAVSVPSNIAEGTGRNSDADFARFLANARGSLFEVQTQLMLGKRLGLLKSEAIRPAIDLTNEVGRLLNALMNRLS